MVAPPHDPPRILVVDDEPDIAESMVDLVHSVLPEAQVRQACTGQEALEQLKAEPVDLIVTDFMMPGMNGMELLHEALRFAPGTPNIMVTAYGPEVVRRAGPPPPQRLLHKPFDIDEFVGAIEAALASP